MGSILYQLEQTSVPKYLMNDVNKEPQTKILIVDDDTFNRFSLTQLIEQIESKIKVIEATNGQ